MAVKTCIMVGGSGMGGKWIQSWKKNFKDRVKIVGLVDTLPSVLEQKGQELGLNRTQLFTDFHCAFDTVKADFCSIAIPPTFHSQVAVAALERGLPVICEKPIANTLKSAKNMVRTAQKTGLPCSIIQNYRYAPNKQEFVKIREDRQLGRLQHILGRYASDYRKYRAWGKSWRHDMEFGLLFEASVHHFDMLRFLSGGDCVTLAGFGWNPEWSSFKHHSSGMYLLKMNNNTHTFYEGNSSAAGITNSWYKEYYRAEFEAGTVEIYGTTRLKITKIGQETKIYDAPKMRWEGHNFLFNEFLNWLDGSNPSTTQIQDNIKSFAMVIGAMETTQDGQPRNIPEYLSDLEL